MVSVNITTKNSTTCYMHNRLVPHVLNMRNCIIPFDVSVLSDGNGGFAHSLT